MVKNNQEDISYLYWIGGIAVDNAQVCVGDLKCDFKNAIDTAGDGINDDGSWHYDIFQNLNDNNQSDSIIFSNGCDGLYTYYVGVDQFNAIKKIFVEVQYPEFSNFKNEGNKSKSGRSYLPYRWGKLVFNDQFTSKLDNFEKSILSRDKIINPARIKLFDLPITSGFIMIDDSPPFYKYKFGDEDEEFTSEELKEINDDIEENYINKKSIPVDFDQVFPVTNKSYPVYAYCYSNESDDYNYNFVKIVIEDIEGCYLSKDVDGNLIFERKNKKSKMVENIINKKYKTASLDNIDLRKSTSLKHLKGLDDVEHLTLKGLEGDQAWDIKFIAELKHLKKITLDNCVPGIHMDLANNFLIRPKIDRYGHYSFGNVYRKKTYQIYKKS
tara:strand:- start:698 stop:1846 length:1149 start_codon:yes stop_codon:yes gene_type:complete